MMKFTVLIDSLNRDRNDLFVSVIEVKTLADIEFGAVADYNRQHDSEMAFAEHEAMLIAVCAGEVQFAWNPDGLKYSEISYDVMAGRLCMPSEGSVWSRTCRTSSRQDEPELPKPRLTLPPGTMKAIDFGPLELRYLAMCAEKPDTMKYIAGISGTPEEMAMFRDNLRKSMTDIPAWAIRPVEHDAELDEPMSLEHITLVEDIKVNVRQKTRFPEVDKLAIISTSHISAENLRAIDSQQANDDLPYWIVSTGFGYIIRFETAVQNWEAGCESQPDLMHPFSEAHLDDTFSALCVELKDYGFNGMHLDADADEIDGLQTYEHS